MLTDRKKIEKVVLIQPPDPEGTIVIRDHMGRFGIKIEKASASRYDVFPPLNLAYCASLLENNGFDAAIVDSPTLNLNRSKILRRVVGENPDLIIVNTSGVTISSDLDLASWLKNTLEIETIAMVPMYIPEDKLNNSDISVFVFGEAENTVLELCKKYPDIKQIKGAAYKSNGKIRYNAKRPLIKDLDNLPFPAYHLLPMEKYSNQMFKQKRFTTALTSRGCPYGCIYCLYPAGYGDVWRGRSPKNVIEELKILEEKHKVRSILFRDQVFNFNIRRAEEICGSIVKEGIDIKWRCEARVDLLPKSLMIKMKKAGCAGIHVGVESGDPVILKAIAKRGISSNHINKIKAVFRDAKEIDLEILAFFMIGFPGETKKSISKTFELAREIKAKQAWFTPIVPYPGTALYELAKSKGWLLTENLEEYTARDVAMRTDELTKEDIRKAVDEGNMIFSKDRTQLLKTIFSTQGIYSLLLNPKRALNYTLGRVLTKKFGDDR